MVNQLDMVEEKWKQRKTASHFDPVFLANRKAAFADAAGNAVCVVPAVVAHALRRIDSGVAVEDTDDGVSGNIL